MISVVVQAGGRSTRMGRDKALVLLGGRPLIQHVIRRVEGLADEILLTTDRPQDLAFLGLGMAEDEVPGAGALHGLRTALQAAQGETVLLLACDMPFVSRPLLEHMLARAGEAEVVVPYKDGNFEPLHAVYARSCLPHVVAALEAGERRMTSFYPQVRVLRIEEPGLSALDPSGLSIFNINTPEDLEQAEQLLQKTQPDI